MSHMWKQLFTVERSGQPEIRIHGIVAVSDNQTHLRHASGDTDFQLWSRSLLKPWQLLCHLPILKAAYPKLTSQHLALMLSSHNAEPQQLNLLEEILSMGDLSESALQCSACYPMSAEQEFALKFKGAVPSHRYNPCSGKHSGALLALKATQQPLQTYLSPQGPQYRTLKTLLAFLLNHDDASFLETVDGCGMPNYAISAAEMANLYRTMASGQAPSNPPGELAEMMGHFGQLRNLMHDHPFIVGGTGRLDSRLMNGELTDAPNLRIIAKEGADGLLGVGIAPTSEYPLGIGLLIKLASGYEPRHLEIVVKNLLYQLGLRNEGTQSDDTAVVKTLHHVHLTMPQEV